MLLNSVALLRDALERYTRDVARSAGRSNAAAAVQMILAALVAQTEEDLQKVRGPLLEAQQVPPWRLPALPRQRAFRPSSELLPAHEQQAQQVPLWQ
jgi:hypothetical protein